MPGGEAVSNSTTPTSVSSSAPNSQLTSNTTREESASTANSATGMQLYFQFRCFLTHLFPL